MQYKSNPSVSVVIRAFNEARHIGRLLEGIAKQTVKDVEVVLVDSGSTDETVAIGERHGAKVVHITPEAFTFGHSLNRGIAAASGEFIVIASAHVYPVYADWIERLLGPFLVEEPAAYRGQVGLVYGKQRGYTGSKFSEHEIFKRWYPEQSQLRQYHPFCNNANAAIRRSLWLEQPYDETLPGLEDLAWANQLIKRGYVLAYIAEAEIIHIHNETPTAVYNRYRREAMAFKRTFPDEHFHLWDFVRLAVGSIASDLWHAARQPGRRGQRRSIIWFRLMQFWGTYQGYRQPGQLTWQLRQTFYYPRGVAASSGRPTPREVALLEYTENPIPQDKERE